MSLKRQIATMKRENTRMVRVRPVRGNPKPINTNGTVYVSRTFQLTKISSNFGQSLSVQDIKGALGASSATEDIRVDFIKLWNSDIGRSIQAKLHTNKFLQDGAGTTWAYPDVQGQDFGTSNSLAGLKFDIPVNQTLNITGMDSATNLVTVNTGATADKVVYQVGVRFAI